jgi:predicted nucleotidyltransferase
MGKREDLDIINEKITRYIELLREKKIEFSSVYLFGSFAKNFFNDYSDIDIAIIMKKLENAFDESVEMTMIGSKIDSRIEPHLFLESDFNERNPFAKEILNYGIKIC